MARNIDTVAVDDFQHLAANKQHILQTLDMEGRLIRLLFAAGKDGNTQIFTRGFRRQKAFAEKR